MKKIIALLTILSLFTAIFAGCSGSVKAAPVVVNADEAQLYNELFHHDGAETQVDKECVKEGIFATIYDAYLEGTRYYVWGFNDELKSGQWQWEIHPEDTSSLPSVGSKVSVTGTLVHDDGALDGYWLINPSIEVNEKYSGYDCDIDLTVMSPTLQRVQVQNIQRKQEQFEGKTVALYGRSHEGAAIMNPYGEEVWEFSVKSDDAFPQENTMILVQGTVTDGAIAQASVAETDLY